MDKIFASVILIFSAWNQITYVTLIMMMQSCQLSRSQEKGLNDFEFYSVPKERAAFVHLLTHLFMCENLLGAMMAYGYEKTRKKSRIHARVPGPIDEFLVRCRASYRESS